MTPACFQTGLNRTAKRPKYICITNAHFQLNIDMHGVSLRLEVFVQGQPPNCHPTSHSIRKPCYQGISRPFSSVCWEEKCQLLQACSLGHNDVTRFCGNLCSDPGTPSIPSRGLAQISASHDFREAATLKNMFCGLTGSNMPARSAVSTYEAKNPRTLDSVKWTMKAGGRQKV